MPYVPVDIREKRRRSAALRISNFKAALSGFEKLTERVAAQKKDERAGVFTQKEGEITDYQAAPLGLWIRTKKCFKS